MGEAPARPIDDASAPRRIRFFTAPNGARIAYATAGSGPALFFTALNGVLDRQLRHPR